MRLSKFVTAKAETLAYIILGLTVIAMVLLALRYAIRFTSRGDEVVSVPMVTFVPMPTSSPTSIPPTPEPTQPFPTATFSPTSVVVTVRIGDSWQRLVRRECYSIGIDVQPVDVAYLAELTKSHNQCHFETEFAPCQFLPSGRQSLYAGDTVMVLCER